MVNFAEFYEGSFRDLVTVVAFDPGGRTGYAVLGCPPEALNGRMRLREHLAHIEYGEIDCGAGGDDVEGENAGVDKMVLMLRHYTRCAVVCEDFVLDFNQATMARHTLVPVRVIAAFRYAMSRSNTHIFMQNRSLAKTTCTDERLKEWNLYDLHSGAHARDAIRHAYYFLRTCQGHTVEAEEKRHMAWPYYFQDPMNIKRSRSSGRGGGEHIPGLG